MDLDVQLLQRNPSTVAAAQAVDCAVETALNAAYIQAASDQPLSIAGGKSSSEDLGQVWTAWQVWQVLKV